MDLSRAKPIELKDKSVFDDYFKRFPPEISEFTFTNLVMWRNHYNFLFTEWNDHLIIFSRDFLKNSGSYAASPESLFFLAPIGQNPHKVVIKLFKSIKNIEFHRVPETIAVNFIEHINDNNLDIEIVDDRDNWDYVYEIESIKNLSGNKHRQNRRWLNKFLDNYDYEFNLLTEDWVEKCKELQLEWCIMRGCEEDESLLDEQNAIHEALNNFNNLNFHGGIMCVENRCVAYTFGEMLNQNTLVIHIEKAHMEYEGSYQAINNLFLKNVNLNAEYVNREQDLGIPGLKRAKESYKPYRMVKKSILYLKND
jgi:hypothetical protein